MFWDKRVLELVDIVIGCTLFLVGLEIAKMASSGLFQGCMVWCWTLVNSPLGRARCRQRTVGGPWCV